MVTDPYLCIDFTIKEKDCSWIVEYDIVHELWNSMTTTPHEKGDHTKHKHKSRQTIDNNCQKKTIRKYIITIVFFFQIASDFLCIIFYFFGYMIMYKKIVIIVVFFLFLWKDMKTLLLSLFYYFCIMTFFIMNVKKNA